MIFSKHIFGLNLDGSDFWQQGQFLFLILPKQSLQMIVPHYSQSKGESGKSKQQMHESWSAESLFVSDGIIKDSYRAGIFISSSRSYDSFKALGPGAFID